VVVDDSSSASPRGCDLVPLLQKVGNVKGHRVSGGRQRFASSRLAPFSEYGPIVAVPTDRFVREAAAPEPFASKTKICKIQLQVSVSHTRNLQCAIEGGVSHRRFGGWRRGQVEIVRREPAGS
jgi:hypothetical protein